MTAAIIILLVFIVWTPFVALIVENDVTYYDPEDTTLSWAARLILLWFLPMFAGMALIDIVMEGKVSADAKELLALWWAGVTKGEKL